MLTSQQKENFYGHLKEFVNYAQHKKLEMQEQLGLVKLANRHAWWTSNKLEVEEYQPEWWTNRRNALSKGYALSWKAKVVKLEHEIESDRLSQRKFRLITENSPSRVYEIIARADRMFLDPDTHYTFRKFKQAS